jgi:MFS family permease
MLVITPFAGYLADRMDRNVLTCIGLLVLLISQIGYVSYPQTINYWRILVPVMGMALFLSLNNAITMGTVEQQLSGIAGSFNSFARTLGMTIGISMASALLFAQLPGVNHITPQLGVVFMRAFSHVFIFAAFLSLIAFIVAVSRLFVARRHLKNN